MHSIHTMAVSVHEVSIATVHAGTMVHGNICRRRSRQGCRNDGIVVLVTHSTASCHVLAMLVVKVLVVHVGVLVAAGTTSYRGGVLDAIRLRDSFEEASFQLAEFRS